MSKPTEQLTITDICTELRISRSTFYEWRIKGRAPRMRKLPNGEYRISRKKFEEWFDSLEEAA